VILPALPAMLAPPPPFPLVTAQSRSVEFVAPGIVRGTYRLQTSEGPLVVNVVAIDPGEPSVRFGTVVANDRMISSGETVSSMAKRTGAVAGVNADYFDIGNTNQPLNLVVRDGALLRTPSKRIVLDVRADRTIRFENFAFSGNVALGAATVPLTAVNEWPPEGGASFLTPSYGALKAAPGVSIAELVPADSVHAATDIAGTYRVASVESATARTVAGPLLGFGPAALALGPLPSAGDSVTVTAATTPPLDGIVSAVGGGPLLLADGARVEDPNSPAPEESAVRFPVSGAAQLPGGEVLFAAVDGRAPDLSIGLTRPEFASLFLGFAATDAMAFDSGGSATLVARVLGDRDSSLLSVPSDGEERPVADGLFAYSDAPLGPPARLVVRPAAIVALAREPVSLRLDIVDGAGHALGPAHLPGGDVLETGTASSTRTLHADGVAGSVPIEIVDRIARLTIEAGVSNPDPGAVVQFGATGFDERGRVVELGGAVRWSADRGTFSSPGRYRAAGRDARIVAVAAGARATFELPVGRRDVALPFFDAAHGGAWQFGSAPSGSAGAVTLHADSGSLELAFDFSAGERAAYANTDLALPGAPRVFAVDVFGNRNGVGIRAAFVNKFGERRALTLVRSVDWSGWQQHRVVLPDDLNPPVRLVALYAVDSLANAATHGSGSIAFRNASATIEGTP
jgi:exopolysaccharide biosynthesis protein